MNRTVMIAAITAVLVVSAVGAMAIYYLFYRPVPIQDIYSRLDRYHGRTVSVEGAVQESYTVLGVSYYRLDDGTGRIVVITDRGAPPEGTRIRVRGEVRQLLKLEDINLVVLLAGKSFSEQQLAEGLKLAR